MSQHFHSFEDGFRFGLHEFEVVAVPDKRLEFLTQAVVANAYYWSSRALYNLDELGNSTTISSAAAIDFVHDDNRLLCFITCVSCRILEACALSIRLPVIERLVPTQSTNAELNTHPIPTVRSIHLQHLVPKMLTHDSARRGLSDSRRSTQESRLCIQPGHILPISEEAPRTQLLFVASDVHILPVS